VGYQSVLVDDVALALVTWPRSRYGWEGWFLGSLLTVGGALAAIPLLLYSGATIVAFGAGGPIYLSNLLGNLAILIARGRGGQSRTRHSSFAAGARW
jgi:hypothetical protein